ncbi:hypothetical protein RHSIM_Rhsim04G0037900 [Rhododendron simsii]|uniref:Uncharacterized protein n=1 Tax=Rhododendron simsii TaxID=118357 RepID=A0A834LSJ4_RHOSS|nr:hypothetical protein RHSIM_Rhsim04G0037900 [Rhododendron simsii]
MDPRLWHKVAALSATLNLFEGLANGNSVPVGSHSCFACCSCNHTSQHCEPSHSSFISWMSFGNSFGGLLTTGIVTFCGS